MNSKVDNFYEYVNSDWLKKNKIPDDQNRWGNFNILDENNKKKVKILIEESINSKNQNFKKLGILYNQGLNLKDRKEQSQKNISKYLNKINNISNKNELMDLIYNDFIYNQFSCFFTFYVYSDYSNSNFNILHISPSGLGLPDREYYFSKDKENHRKKYKKFINEYSSLFNLELDSDLVYNFEEYMAKFHYTKTQKRDPNINNNPTNYKDFNKKYKNIIIKKLFDKFNVSISDSNKINITNPIFFEELNKIINSVSLKILKQYLSWKFVLSISNLVDEPKEQKYFDFYGNFLSGTINMKPLWKRSLSNVSNQLGNLIGKMYVDKYFSNELKNKVDNMVKFIKDELRDRLLGNEWMEDETRIKAVEKIDKMNIKCGYPEKWRDYTGLNINENNSYFENNINCNNFEMNYEFSELYKEKDKLKWLMPPHMVNAYYAPSYNEIVFPAGILQPPFFDGSKDMSTNFGSIGCVIGHEMTHGFDDQGKKYDSNGDLNLWWTKKDSEKYTEKTKNLENQFANYKIEGKNVDGKLTLGENIADLGGVSISLSALTRYLKDNNITDENVVDLEKIKFFKAYSKMWRCKCRKEELLRRLISDVHSPPVYRVNGILGNIDCFNRIYNLKKGDNLFIEKNKRTKIW